MPKTTDFYLCLDEERAQEWVPILGTRSLPIRWGEFQADLQGAGNLPPDGVQDVVLLDLECLSENEINSICQHFSSRSGVPAAEIRADIELHGLPIRTAGANLVIRNPQRWV